MKPRLLTISGIVLCLAAALSAMVIRIQDQKGEGSLTESGNFDEDYLFLGRTLTFSGTAEDLIFLGERLVFSGTTELTLISLGERVDMSGRAGNGVIAGAMNVDIDGTVDDNSFIACRTLRISEQAVVNGTLFAGCQRLILEGRIEGDLYVGASNVVINGEVDGNVRVYAGRVSIGENGSISGNLIYTSPRRLSEQEQARVDGRVIYDEKRADGKEGLGWLGQLGVAIAFFLSFVVTGILLLFIPAFRSLEADQSRKGFWIKALWGLIPLLIYPAVVVLCFVLIITIPLGLVLILAALPLFYLVYIIGTVLLGKYLVSIFKWNVHKRHYQFLIGALAVFILSLIPFINFLAFIFVTALGWGSMAGFLFRKDLSEAGGRNQT